MLVHRLRTADPGLVTRLVIAGVVENKGVSSKDDLIAAVQKWLDEHTDHNRTVVEQLMNDAGHTLVYTPPFCPEVQPIEFLWAKIKRYVADRSIHKRSMTEARAQTEEAFEQVTKMFCNSVVRHCHNWIDQFLCTDTAEDFHQCGCLAGVMKHLQLLKLAETTQQHSTTASPAPIQPAASNECSHSTALQHAACASVIEFSSLFSLSVKQ